MSKSAFLDMLKSSSDKARIRETNEKQKYKVIYVNLLMKPSQLRPGIPVWTNECKSSAAW